MTVSDVVLSGGYVVDVSDSVTVTRSGVTVASVYSGGRALSTVRVERTVSASRVAVAGRVSVLVVYSVAAGVGMVIVVVGTGAP